MGCSLYLNIVVAPRRGGVAWHFQVGIKGVKLSRIRGKQYNCPRIGNMEVEGPGGKWRTGQVRHRMGECGEQRMTK